MKSLLKYFMMFIGILLFSLIPFENTFSAKVLLPNTTRQEDVNINEIDLNSNNTNESTIFQYIKVINTYLWFSIGGIAMAILMYAGILLITAGGDKGKVGKAGKMALYSLIGIFVSVISYTLVNLIVNLL